MKTTYKEGDWVTFLPELAEINPRGGITAVWDIQCTLQVNKVYDRGDYISLSFAAGSHPKEGGGGGSGNYADNFRHATPDEVLKAGGKLNKIELNYEIY